MEIILMGLIGSYLVFLFWRKVKQIKSGQYCSCQEGCTKMCGICKK